MNYPSLTHHLHGIAVLCLMLTFLPIRADGATNETSSEQLPVFSCGAISPPGPIVFDQKGLASNYRGGAAPADVRLTLTGGNCSIFLDDINGLNFKVGQGSTYNFVIQSRSQSIQESASLGFTVYSPDGSLTAATISNLNLSSDWASSGIYWTDGGGVLDPADLDGTLPDSWSVSGLALAGGGFIATEYVEVVSFDLKLPNVSGVLCIDSIFVPPAAIWLMTPDGPPAWFAGSGDASVGGSRTNALCMTLFQIPCLGVQYTVTVDSLSTSYCAPANYQVVAVDLGGNHTVSYNVEHDGAGDALVDGAGNVTYTPSPADTNSLVTVSVYAREPAMCGDGAKTTTKIAVTYDAPHLTCPPPDSMVLGNTATFPPPGLVDNDPCDIHAWSIVSIISSPLGTVSIDPVTGAISYESDVNDPTQFDVTLSTTDGLQSDECVFTFSLLQPSACCNLAGDANNDEKVNISDVTFLIARIFAGGSAPNCCGEGDPDASGKVNIADITFLISRIFAGGIPPGCGPMGINCS